MDDSTTWVGVESLTESSAPSGACPDAAAANPKEEHVVWVIVPNAGSSVSSENNQQMIISSTTETVVDPAGNKTSIQIAEITHQRKKTGRKNLAGSKFVCDVCGLKYSRNFNLRRHKENVHATTTVSICCPYCTSTFTRHDNLTQHIKFVHNGQGNHTCGYCGKHFSRKHTMEEHVNVQHFNQKRYECFKCSKVFGYPWSLYNHIRVKHESDGAFKCYYCAKVFATIRCLRNHVLSIHEGVRYKCKICAKILKCQSAYKSHLKMFHLPRNNKDQYFCSRCTFKCTKRAELVRHMSLTHQWREINVCPICHKPVKHKNTFERHLMVHNQNENDVTELLRRHVTTAADHVTSAADHVTSATDHVPMPHEQLPALVVAPEPKLTPVEKREEEAGAAAVGPRTRRRAAAPSTVKDPQTIFQCSHCPKVVQSRPALDRHYSRAHAFLCSYCGVAFMTRDAVEAHEVKFHAGEVVVVRSGGVKKEEEDVDVDVGEEDLENPMWSLEEMVACVGAAGSGDGEWIVQEEGEEEEEEDELPELGGEDLVSQLG